MNPELDPEQVEGGEEGVRGHASTRMKEKEGEEAWSVVRVEGRDWGRVLGVGRLGGRVIACECSSSPGYPPIQTAEYSTRRFLPRTRPDSLRLSLSGRYRIRPDGVSTSSPESAAWPACSCILANESVQWQYYIASYTA